MRLRTALPAIVLLIVTTGNTQQRHKKTSQPKFDYYLLSLSWAPNYCAGHSSDKSAECKAGNHTGFVLHGLWPQASAGQPPMNCGHASPASSDVVRHMSEFFPDKSMVQHEWTKHGTCSGLSAADYFEKVEQAFKAVQVPEQFSNLAQQEHLGVKQVEQAFAQANNAPSSAFRISCHAGEMVNLEVCLTKDLRYQACTSSVHDCSSTKVLMRPPR
jgi:ribonuclease T2